MENTQPPWMKIVIEREEPTKIIVSAMRDLSKDDAIARLCSWFSVDQLKYVAESLKHHAEEQKEPDHV